MKRRQYIGVAAGLLFLSAGCLGTESDSPQITSSSIQSAEFSLVEPELAVEDPPVVEVEGETITVRGTVQYGSSSCGTVKLAYADYENSQDRLDLLIVAGDDTEDNNDCTDDIAVTGYRAKISTVERLRRVATTEHHIFGETYSKTTDLTDY